MVTPRVTTLDLPPEGLRLEAGGVLKKVDVAWESCGLEKPENDNVIFICHALTGDAHVAGRYENESAPTGWWDGMIGPGRAIDTAKYRVICANVLGGCKGTTGPSSVNPETGEFYGSAFPLISMGDMVDVYRLLLKQLGITHLKALVGGSFGGIHVIDWLTRHPGEADMAVMVASGGALSPQALSFDIVARHAIMDDPEWNGGDYYGKRGPVHGLSSARQLAHITYLSYVLLQEKFGRRLQQNWLDRGPQYLMERARNFGTNFQIESYLDHQAEKFIARFDANSYLHLTRALDEFDVAERFGGLEKACERITARLLLVSLSGDWLFSEDQSQVIATAMMKAKTRVSYAHLDVKVGHDGFLTHITELAQVVGGFLNERKMNVTETKQGQYQALVDMIKPSARVLDIGCGNGQLLSTLREKKNISGVGIDIDIPRLATSVHAGNDILYEDADDRLALIPDKSFDQVVVNETLPVLKRPDDLIGQLLRVADEAIVGFQNFGQWTVWAQLALHGRMPVAKQLPYAWYDTPNIHFFTLRDFKEMCARHGIEILETRTEARTWFGRLLLSLGFKNQGAEHVVCRLGRIEK
ncbi:MAG: homoserine O-acetyltransferase [Kiritimatiellae bacterium]|nr:homoserine O-acetyltransferase [Kiritimatiellia bacterium]